MTIHLHFGFPDGVLHYDCARCSALCCKGHGVGAHRRELVQLLQKAPALATWSTTRNRDMVYFQNPVGRCFFLNARDRCSAEEELGRVHKPSMCKAFPFNRVSLLGETHVVTPNFLCPLTLEAKSSANAGQHATLGVELEQAGWFDQDFPQLPLHDSETPADFLRAEQALRDACAAALADDSASTLASLCEADAQDVAEPAQWLECGDANASATNTSRFEAMFLALAPIWSLELSHVPRLARRRALLLARLHISRALDMDGVAPTLQVAYGLFAAHAALYELLGQLDSPMPAGLLIDSGDGPTLLAAAVIDRLARVGASVQEALREGCEGLSLIDRQTLLSSLGTLQRKRVLRALNPK